MGRELFQFLLDTLITRERNIKEKANTQFQFLLGTLITIFKNTNTMPQVNQNRIVIRFQTRMLVLSIFGNLNFAINISYTSKIL
jgi:hypothetical protein